MSSAIRSMLVVSIYNLTLKPYTDRGKLSIIVVHSFVRDPHIPVAMRFMMVTNISIPQLTLRSISFTFKDSLDIILTGLFIFVDPKVPYSSLSSLPSQLLV